MKGPAPSIKRGVAPAALVIVVAVATWLISGVAALDVIRFLAYEIGFVYLPGAALLWALRGRRPGPLLSIALGWPLGHTLEILAFSATAAIGSRGLYLLYPVFVLLISWLLVGRRSHGGRRGLAAGDAMSGPQLWTAAAALSLGLVYLAFMFLPGVPLPSGTRSVAYYLDFPFFMGLTAEALNHWPANSPGLSGIPLHYEWFVFYHMAAASSVTHVSIPTIALRLDYVPTMVVIGCQLLAVGRFLGRAAWTGVIAIVVVFLLGPLDLTTDVASSPFADRLTFHLWASWTFPFGLMFFLALLGLVTQRLQAPTWRSRSDIGSWVLIALLMVGASGAKATVLPVIITGTGLYAVFVFVTRKRVSAPALAALGLGIAIFVLTFAVVYGGGIPGTIIEPIVWLGGTAPVVVARGITSPGVRAVVMPFAYIAGLAGALLPLAGTLYLLRRKHRGEISSFTLCICTFLGGLLISLVVHQISYSEEYFLDTGFVACCIAAAEGLRRAWLDAGRAIVVSRRAVILAFAAWVALLILLVVITARAIAHPDAVAVRYVGLVVGSVTFVLLWGIVLRARRRATSGLVALALVPLVAASALTSPILVSPVLHRVLTGASITPALPDPKAGLTPGLLTGLRWLNAHSSVDSVLAVNNHWLDPGEINGNYFYYSAFSERRVFVEAYNPIRYGVTSTLATATAAGVAFAYRRRLNDAVFDDASAEALRILTRQYSVRWLFIDRVHHGANLAVLQLGHVVFSDSDVLIVAVG